MIMLCVKNLSVRYGSHAALKNVSFTIENGQWLMIAGPNGAGKSTLLAALSGSAAYEGEAAFDGADLRRMKPKERARKIGVLSQNHSAGYAFTVGEVARLGRYAYSGSPLAPTSGEDERAVRSALEMTGMLALENREITALSGGELQRAFLAQLFAQSPRLLLLDEPANHLDPVYQKQIFELVGEWLKTPGRAVASVVHDLSLARAYGDRALLLKEGEALALGEADEVFSRKNLVAAYSMDVGGWLRGLLTAWS